MICLSVKRSGFVNKTVESYDLFAYGHARHTVAHAKTPKHLRTQTL
jgi:hypothetical protein